MKTVTLMMLALALQGIPEKARAYHDPDIQVNIRTLTISRAPESDDWVLNLQASYKGIVSWKAKILYAPPLWDKVQAYYFNPENPGEEESARNSLEGSIKHALRNQPELLHQVEDLVRDQLEKFMEERTDKNMTEDRQDNGGSEKGADPAAPDPIKPKLKGAIPIKFQFEN